MEAAKRRPQGAIRGQVIGIPEPSSFAAITVTAIGLAARRRRRAVS